MNAEYDQNQATLTIAISKLQALYHQEDTAFSLADQLSSPSNQCNDKNQNQIDTLETMVSQIQSGTLASIATKPNLPDQHCYAYLLRHATHAQYGE